MKKYKVYWEVRKHTIVDAFSHDEAVDKVWEDSDNLDIVEDEITTSLEAEEVKE